MDSQRPGAGGGKGDGSGGGRASRVPSYDGQAGTFDARTGLPPAAVEAIVEALARLGDLGPGRTVLELGTGTGQLGIALAGRTGHYVGVERAGAMLHEFRARPAPVGASVTLLQADANERWPLEDGTAALVFGSRSLHLLDPGHLVSESLRVAARRGAVVCAGGLVRDPEGIRRRMRGEMRRILEARHQIVGRKSGDDDRGWMDALALRGGQPLERLVVASWPVVVRPADSLRSWRHKQGLAGHDVSEAVKADVLDRLEAWAVEHYGSLEAAVPTEERYALWAVRLPQR